MQEEIRLEEGERKIKYEGVSIYLTYVAIEKIVGLQLAETSPFTHVMHLASFNQSATDRTLVGDLHVTFRNQGADNNFGIMLITKLSSKGGLELSEANIVARTVQYLFKFINNYVDKENILDGNGDRFIIPQYLYSPAYFEPDFPS